MPTRSIGDEYFRSVGIITDPFTNLYMISNNDLMLIAACDGLFDVMSNQEVAEFVRQYREIESLINSLKEEILIHRMGSDNLTVIVLDLKGLIPKT